MPKYDYDILPIAGSAGFQHPASLVGMVRVRQLSRPTGSAGHVFCVGVPKKLLIYGAHYADHIVDARNYGWTFDARHDWGGAHR